MAVHVFPIESVRQSILGGDSIKNVYRMARVYLRQHSQSGETNDSYMKCEDVTAVERAVSAFLEWASNRPDSDPKVLWLSLHGKPPQKATCVGTERLSASYNVNDPEAEIVQWAMVFEKLCGNCPPNTILLSDVCWGASPTAPACLTSNGAKNPTMFFGPIRKSHRLELDTAAGLVFGLLSRVLLSRNQQDISPLSSSPGNPLGPELYSSWQTWRVQYCVFQGWPIALYRYRI